MLQKLRRSTILTVCRAAPEQILGVAGKLVRTPGPRRCVFSTGRLASKGRRDGLKGVDPANEEHLTSLTTATNSSGSGRAGADRGGEVGALPSLLPGAGGSVGGGAGGEKVVSIALGGEDKPSARCNGGVVAAGAAKEGGGGGDSCGGGLKDGVIDALTPGEEGLIYLNAATGETTRDAPAELIVQAEEAHSTGEYLVFVPSRSFVAAVASSVSSSSVGAVVAAATASSTPGKAKTNSAVAAAGGSVSQTVGRSPAAGVSVEQKPAARIGDAAGELQQGRPPVAPTPPTVTPATRRFDGGGGGEKGARQAWDRLASVSEPATTTPSRLGALIPSTAATTYAAGARGSRLAKTGDRMPAAAAMTIDLSQGVAAPLVVQDSGVRDGRGGVDVNGCVVGEADAAARGVTDGVWACVKCTLDNETRVRFCEACGTRKPTTASGSQVRASWCLESGVG